jgi:miniconductance mechanosensitive channel
MSVVNFLKFDKYFEQILIGHGIGPSLAGFFNIIILCFLIAIIAVLSNYIFKKIIIRIIKFWVDKSSNTYDDIFYEKGVFNKLSHLAPAIIISCLASVPFNEYKIVIELIKTAASIYILVIVLIMLNSVINAFHEIYNQMPAMKNRTIRGYVQMIKSIVFFIGSLMILSVLIKRDLSSLFAGLTAFAAVLMFIFKDTLLGLIAGIQISANDILRVGDYIEMPNRNADGTIVDISLTTVKVHNANLTFTTIPTYAFVSESFWNWRGLEVSNGRRIKKHINIDMHSIKYCDDKILEQLKNFEFLKHFFEPEKPAFGQEDRSNNISEQITNSALFRIYAEAFLRNNPDLNTQMTFLVRYLQPTEHGLPLEIYVHTNEKEIHKFEKIQSEILDHLIAIIPLFELRVFQKFTGYIPEKI